LEFFELEPEFDELDEPDELFLGHPSLKTLHENLVIAQSRRTKGEGTSAYVLRLVLGFSVEVH